MKRRLRKALSLVLSAAMLVSIIPTYALADTADQTDSVLVEEPADIAEEQESEEVPAEDQQAAESDTEEVPVEVTELEDESKTDDSSASEAVEVEEESVSEKAMNEDSDSCEHSSLCVNHFIVNDDGSITYDMYCSDCGTVSSRETLTADNFTVETYDGYKCYNFFSSLLSDDSTSYEFDVYDCEEHSYCRSNLCVSDGCLVVEYICSSCHKKKEISIPATDYTVSSINADCCNKAGSRYECNYSEIYGENLPDYSSNIDVTIYDESTAIDSNNHVGLITDDDSYVIDADGTLTFTVYCDSCGTYDSDYNYTPVFSEKVKIAKGKYSLQNYAATCTSEGCTEVSGAAVLSNGQKYDFYKSISEGAGYNPDNHSFCSGIDFEDTPTFSSDYRTVSGTVKCAGCGKLVQVTLPLIERWDESIYRYGLIENGSATSKYDAEIPDLLYEYYADRAELGDDGDTVTLYLYKVDGYGNRWDECTANVSLSNCTYLRTDAATCTEHAKDQYVTAVEIDGAKYYVEFSICGTEKDPSNHGGVYHRDERIDNDAKILYCTLYCCDCGEVIDADFSYSIKNMEYTVSPANCIMPDYVKHIYFNVENYSLSLGLNFNDTPVIGSKINKNNHTNTYVKDIEFTDDSITGVIHCGDCGNDFDTFTVPLSECDFETVDNTTTYSFTINGIDYSVDKTDCDSEHAYSRRRAYLDGSDLVLVYVCDSCYYKKEIRVDANSYTVSPYEADCCNKAGNRYECNYYDIYGESLPDYGYSFNVTIFDESSEINPDNHNCFMTKDLKIDDDGNLSFTVYCGNCGTWDSDGNYIPEFSKEVKLSKGEYKARYYKPTCQDGGYTNYSGTVKISDTQTYDFYENVFDGTEANPENHVYDYSAEFTDGYELSSDCGTVTGTVVCPGCGCSVEVTLKLIGYDEYQGCSNYGIPVNGIMMCTFSLDNAESSIEFSTEYSAEAVMSEDVEKVILNLYKEDCDTGERYDEKTIERNLSDFTLTNTSEATCCRGAADEYVGVVKFDDDETNYYVMFYIYGTEFNSNYHGKLYDDNYSLDEYGNLSFNVYCSGCAAYDEDNNEKPTLVDTVTLKSNEYDTEKHEATCSNAGYVRVSGWTTLMNGQDYWFNGYLTIDGAAINPDNHPEEGLYLSNIDFTDDNKIKGRVHCDYCGSNVENFEVSVSDCDIDPDDEGRTKYTFSVSGKEYTVYRTNNCTHSMDDESTYSRRTAYIDGDYLVVVYVCSCCYTRKEIRILWEECERYSHAATCSSAAYTTYSYDWTEDESLPDGSDYIWEIIYDENGEKNPKIHSSLTADDCTVDDEGNLKFTLYCSDCGTYVDGEYVPAFSQPIELSSSEYESETVEATCSSGSYTEVNGTVCLENGQSYTFGFCTNRNSEKDLSNHVGLYADNFMRDENGTLTFDVYCSACGECDDDEESRTPVLVDSVTVEKDKYSISQNIPSCTKTGESTVDGSVELENGQLFYFINSFEDGRGTNPDRHSGLSGKDFEIDANGKLTFTVYCSNCATEDENGETVYGLCEKASLEKGSYAAVKHAASCNKGLYTTVSGRYKVSNGQYYSFSNENINDDDGELDSAIHTGLYSQDYQIADDGTLTFKVYCSACSDSEGCPVLVEEISLASGEYNVTNYDASCYAVGYSSVWGTVTLKNDQSYNYSDEIPDTAGINPNNHAYLNSKNYSIDENGTLTFTVYCSYCDLYSEPCTLNSGEYEVSEIAATCVSAGKLHVTGTVTLDTGRTFAFSRYLPSGKEINPDNHNIFTKDYSMDDNGTLTLTAYCYDCGKFEETVKVKSGDYMVSGHYDSTCVYKGYYLVSNYYYDPISISMGIIPTDKKYYPEVKLSNGQECNFIAQIFDDDSDEDITHEYLYPTGDYTIAEDGSLTFTVYCGNCEVYDSDLDEYIYSYTMDITVGKDEYSIKKYPVAELHDGDYIATEIIVKTTVNGKQQTFVINKPYDQVEDRSDDVHVYSSLNYNNDAHINADGSITFTATCSVCGEKEKVTVSPDNYKCMWSVVDAKPYSLEPTINNGIYFYFEGSDGYYHRVYGNVYSDECIKHEVRTIKGKAATCTESGRTDEQYCYRCGKVISAAEEIPALGHSYKQEYSWAANGKTCTATFTCSRGDSTQTLDGTITSKVKTAATYVAKGVTTYTAKFTIDGQTYSSTKDVTDIAVKTKTNLSKATVTLSFTSKTYTGSALKPTVTVKIGTSTVSSSYYTVTYSNNINAGTAKVTITAKADSLFKGGNPYTGSTTPKTFTITKATPKVTAPTAKTLTYTGKAQALVNAGKTTAGTLQYSTDGKTYKSTIPTGTNVGSYTVFYKVVGNTNYNAVAAKSLKVTISPKSVAISSLTNSAAKTLLVKWGRNTTATGYEIQYSTSSKFTSAKTVTITKNSTVSKSITGLTKGKTYYVRVRTYKTVNKVKYYSAWSASKMCKVSK